MSPVKDRLYFIYTFEIVKSYMRYLGGTNGNASVFKRSLSLTG